MHVLVRDLPPVLQPKLEKAANRFARRDPELADELISAAWVRIVEQQHRQYELGQWFVVGLNAMRRALRGEINRMRQVSIIEEVFEDVRVDSELITLRDEVAQIRERLKSEVHRRVLDAFLLDPTTLTASAKSLGLSPATANRVSSAIRAIWFELCPGDPRFVQTITDDDILLAQQS